MSAIFYHNDEQKKLAEDSKERYERRIGITASTEILPLTEFYLAEDYHQKYYLQGSRILMADFDAMYPDWKDFTNSTSAARVNGYLGGYADKKQVLEEIDLLGLTQQSHDRLLDLTGVR
jgi:peptide-methionine (S)-S-oxide reductase